MTPFDRQVRTEIYKLFISGREVVDSAALAESQGWDVAGVSASLGWLQQNHMLGLVPGTDRVQIANPFSGIPTDYVSLIDGRRWYANCAWDGLAVLSLLGDGQMRRLDTGLSWTVRDGAVSPDGFIHLLVPAQRFWDDVAFT